MKRRDFLKITGTTVTALTAPCLFAKTATPRINPMKNYPYASYTEALYHAEFNYTYGNKADHGYAFHCLNCQGNCSWEVWSNNGLVTRENQSAHYPTIHNAIPDFNPRGCNKGVQHSQVMYEKDRLLYPMKRAGKRGEGRWKKISWDMAAEEIAQKIWDKMVQKGPESIYMQAGSGLLSVGRRAAMQRFATQIGAVKLYPASYLGDLFSGAAVAYGEINVGCTYDFLYTADTVIFWGGNPSSSRIPDAHFIQEGKYNGAKLIVITPEYNATAKNADLWIPIKPGSDSYLAMSVMHVILEQKLYKQGFMQSFTDLPFLVRTDTHKLLRRSDMETSKNHKEHHAFDHQFYSWNRTTNTIALMPGTEGSDKKTLRLSDFGIEPELEGRWQIPLKDGTTVEVTTVFELLKENVQQFSPETMQEVTGVHPDTVEELAKQIALPNVVEITVGFSLNKYYNGILSIWNIASICGLTGRMGPYGGLNTENEFQINGLDVIYGFEGKYKGRLGSGFVGEYVYGGMETFDKYFSDEDVRRANNGLSKEDYKKIATAMLEKGRNGKGVAKPFWKPDLAIIAADSRFRRNKGDRYKEEFLKAFEYFAYIDYRVTEVGLYADILLPAKSHYEVDDLRVGPGYHRYANLAKPPVDLKGVGEAKDEWEIFSLIAQKLEMIANQAQNIAQAKIKDDKKYASSGYRDLANFYKEYTNSDNESKAKLKPTLGTAKQAVEAALQSSPQFSGWSIDKMRQQGGYLEVNEKAAQTSPLYQDRPYNSMENHIFKYEILETMSGRQTFYVDHDIWIEMGAQTNNALGDLKPQKEAYPYRFVVNHSKWAIHSTYRSSKTLRRLQRGLPYAEINKEIAAQKNINDGDEIRIYNELGEIFVMAKLSSSVPQNSIIMGHGWEANSYKNGKSHNELVPTALNLLEMTDGWGHLKFGGLWDGNQYAYDGAINFEKV